MDTIPRQVSEREFFPSGYKNISSSDDTASTAMMDTGDSPTIGVVEVASSSHGPLHVDEIVTKVSEDLGEAFTITPPVSPIALVCKEFEDTRTRVGPALVQIMDGICHSIDRDEFERLWGFTASSLNTQLSILRIVDQHVNDMIELSQDKMNAIQNMQVEAALAATSDYSSSSSSQSDQRTMQIDEFVHEMELLNEEMDQNQRVIDVESKIVASLRAEKAKRERARQYNAEYLGMGLVPGIGIASRMDSTLRRINDELRITEERLATHYDLGQSLQVSLFLLWEEGRGLRRGHAHDKLKRSEAAALRELKQHQREYSHWSNVKQVMKNHRAHLKRITTELEGAIRDCQLSSYVGGAGNQGNLYHANSASKIWEGNKAGKAPPPAPPSTPSTPRHHRRNSSCSSMSSVLSSSSNQSLSFSKKGERLLQKLDDAMMVLEEISRALVKAGVKVDAGGTSDVSSVTTNTMNGGAFVDFDMDVVPLY